MTNQTEEKTATGFFIVKNSKGLHTRPSTEIVRCVSLYKSEVKLRYRKETIRANSILSILMLTAGKGSKIHIEAKGEDAEKVVAALIELAQNSFHMNY